jgi:phosphonate transport system ATP-binding protein
VITEPALQLVNVTIAPPGSGDRTAAARVPSSAAPLLREVQLRVAPGERIALVGPSGTGKTTLLRTLNGQIVPVAGQVIVGGTDLTVLTGHARRELRRHIGYVAQKHDLVEPLRVHQNVMAGALGRWSTLRSLRYLWRPTSAELEEAGQALSAVGLAHKLTERTDALSGGEQQRVAIARALVQGPKLLLADEPVASLDPSAAQAVLELLTRLAAERGMALICSLHQPELARRYFDRTLAITNGSLVCEPELRAREASRRSA